ncbi:MAG TPA: sugar phosphate isomerase/epimerase family protein [Gaiellaceae bacterium]|nr:sugar phosphate isomerase/epimerase family protein [Gaiellaceae bacterium]
MRAYAAAGVDGIGVWEFKLPDGEDARALEQLEASGLGSAAAVPAIPSILPLPLMEGPEEPRERVDAICASLHRLAAFQPSGVVCLTGPGTDRDTVVAALRTIGEEAERAGVRVGLEPINRVGGEDWTMISSLPEAVELLEDADRPALGIQFDSWHLWSTPDLVSDIERYADRFVGVHVADWREPTRGWADRVLPGDGVAPLPEILGALEQAGWAGYYDLEVFSDNGVFGNAWPDSLWDVETEELARRGKNAFERVWEARIRTSLDQVSPGAV